jgi:RNA polymerase sigma factor (TIGR02999 family)
MDEPGDITRLLARWSDGDEEAFRALVPIVYDELKRLAEHYLRDERRGHTLQPTALVHEAYLRLAGVREAALNNRTHFYGAAAQVMRRVLVDHARHRGALKRQSPVADPLWVGAAVDRGEDTRVDLVALDEALSKLAAFAPDRATIVELRYFGGLSIDETAEYLGIGSATVKRRWDFARAWLFRALGSDGPAEADPASPHV